MCNGFHSEEALLVEHLNLSKSFDCMYHTTIIRKLFAHNLHPLSYRVLASFLTSRIQRIGFEGKQSEDSSIKLNIPQGSTLGPHFIVFTNDCSFHLKKRGTILYANNTTLVSSGKCLQKAAESAE